MMNFSWAQETFPHIINLTELSTEREFSHWHWQKSIVHFKVLETCCMHVLDVYPRGCCVSDRVNVIIDEKWVRISRDFNSSSGAQKFTVVGSSATREFDVTENPNSVAKLKLESETVSCALMTAFLCFSACRMQTQTCDWTPKKERLTITNENFHRYFLGWLHSGAIQSFPFDWWWVRWTWNSCWVGFLVRTRILLPKTSPSRTLKLIRNQIEI